MIFPSIDFLPPAVAVAFLGPLLAGGASALFGKLFGGGGRSRQTERAYQESLAAQTRAAEEQSGLARLLGSISRDQYSLATPAYKRALDYYSGLVGAGGTGKLQAAIAPDLARLSDIYQGAQTMVESTLRPGGVRDRAIADLAKERAGQAGLVALAGPREAAGKLGELGLGGFSAATGAAGAGVGAGMGAGQTYASLSGLRQRDYELAFERNREFGESLANLLLPFLLAIGGSKTKKVPGSGGTKTASYPAFGTGSFYGAPTSPWSQIRFGGGE